MGARTEEPSEDRRCSAEASEYHLRCNAFKGLLRVSRLMPPGREPEQLERWLSEQGIEVKKITKRRRD